MCSPKQPAFKQVQCEIFKPIFLQGSDFWSEGQSFVFFTKLWKSSTIFQGRTMAMASTNMVSAGGRLCTLQEYPHFLGPDDLS